MSNFEFLLVLFSVNSIVLIGIILRCIRRKSPRTLVKFFFLPILFSLVAGWFIQNYAQLSEVSNRQFFGNLLLTIWLLKSFNSYKSFKTLLLEEFLSSLRVMIKDKKFFKIIILVLKISFMQFLCFCSVFSMNYLSGYSTLGLIDFFGFFICFSGILLELISEKEIRNNISTTSKFISSGPWAYSRHPDLLGMSLFFCGLQVLSFGAVGSEWSIIGFLVFVYIIYGKLAPKIEHKIASKSPEYISYRESVPKLLTFYKK